MEENSMKKLLTFIMSFIMIVSVNMVSFAETNINDIEATSEMIKYEQKLLEEIEGNLDEIHAQIEEYQSNLVSPYGVSYGGFQYLDGDILVTKSTSSAGLTGHAGMIVGEKVLEITPAYNGSVPKAISLATWFARYPSTMVVRYTANRTVPVGAAWYGQTFYVDGEGKDNTYSIASSITSLTSDYCSSLVWKCYHYGADFNYKVILDGPQYSRWVDPTFIYPYDYVLASYIAYNGFSVVNSVNW